MAPTFLKSLLPSKTTLLFSTPRANLGSIPVHGTCSPLPPSIRSISLSGASGVRGLLRLGFEKLPVDVVRRASIVGSGGSGGSGGTSGGQGGGGGSGDGGGDDGRSEGVTFLTWYLKAVDKHPVLTKSITSAFLNLVGDLICQVLINRVSTIDFKRLAVITFLGFALVGPTLHFWYFSLSQVVKFPGTSGTLLRLFLDQFLFSPMFIAVFLSSLVTLEGKPTLVVPKLKQEWVSAVVANWQLWIPFQFLNFQFVPQPLQVLAANIVALAWNVILSFLAHKEVIAK